MRSSLLRSCGVSLLLLGIAGCGSGDNTSADGGAGHAGGNGGKSGKGGGAGQGAVAGGAGQGAAAGGAGQGAAAGGAAGTGTGGTAGRTSVDAGLDLGGIAPPVGLTATVKNRRQTLFELVWTAPSIGGLPVTGYQVRYAKVPITTANFDDTTMTTAVAYAGTPKAPGDTDGMVVKAYIENGYYFAVTGTDAGGAHVGAFMATDAAVTAHFNVTLVNSPSGTNQNFGATLNGSGDVNGDGLSDLLVGTFGDNHAYLFFGGTTFAPTAPGVVFTGANMGFGVVVSQIGDIDHDGLEDIAIADFPTGQQIFIYKGRITWPMTLSDTQADYVITTDATYASSNFGSSIAALGDFNGDGVDDFAIGAPLFNTRVGQVAVVYGRAGFTSFSLPDATMTRALEIGGDPALTRSQLGIAVAGLGHFYSVTTGTTLVASATGLGAASNASNNEGRIYAFHGRVPGAPIDASTADNVRVGLAKGAEIGQVLSNLGPVVNALPAAGAGNTVDTFSISGATGTGFVLSGTVASGPLANLLILDQSGNTAVGQLLFGGGFSGRDSFVSMIGDSKPDIAIAGSGVATIDIIDGSKIPALTSPADSKSVADVHVPLPAGWLGTPVGPGNLVKDLNGDGYPDFALGDLFGTVPGRVAVFW